MSIDLVPDHHERIVHSLIVALLLYSFSARSETYTDCLLSNTKTVVLQSEILLIKRACRNQALPFVPAKCKKPSDISKPHVNPFDKFEDPGIDQDCIGRCLDASAWSKQSGDCSP